MSTQHAAEIKVSLRTSAFSAGLNKMGQETRTFAQSAKSTLSSSFSAGLHGAKEAFHGVTHSAGHLLKTAAAIGAGFSVEHAIHEALNLTSAWKQIAFSIQAGTGKTIDWREEMKEAEDVATKWGVSTEDLTGAYKQLFQQTGNAEFTKHAMNEIAKASQASGASLETVTAIAGEMNEKFGVTAEELPDALRAAVSLSKQGGMSIEEMSEKIGQLGGAAKLMGMDGTRGFQDIVGMANIAQKSLGPMKKTIAAVTGLMTEMTSADFGKKVHQQLGISVTGAGGKLDRDALQKIIQKTGGKEEMLAKVFTGEQLKVVSDLGKVYSKTFDETKGTVKQKTHEATVAYVEALKRAGAATLTKAQMDERAASVAGGPKAEIQKAMNEFAKVFSEPEMMDAIKEFAKLAPKLGHGLAQIAEFMLKHPLLGSAAFLGGRMALGAAAGAGQNLTVSLAKGAVQGLGNKIAQDAARSGAWATVGRTMGVAVAAAVAFEMGRQKIDEDLGKFFSKEKGLQEVPLVVANAHTLQQKEAAIVAIRQRIETEKKEKPGVVASTLGALAGAVTGDTKLTAENQHADAIAKASKELRELEESAAKMKGGGDKTAQSFNMITNAAERAARALNKVEDPQAGNGERGTRSAGGSPSPGAAPRGA